jgi:hypothetical protein
MTFPMVANPSSPDPDSDLDDRSQFNLLISQFSGGSTGRELI